MTCNFAFDEAKNETAQVKKMMWWLVNTLARFSQMSEFDNTYDSKDLWIAACTSNEQHSMIFQGLSQRALLQLDKHSEELALQRGSDPVISTLESIFCFIKTDILELYKPWTSTS